MQETLHLSSPTTYNPFPTLHFPSKPPTSLPLPTKPLHPIPLSLHPIPISPPTPHHHHPQPQFQQTLLYLDSLGIDLLSLLPTHPSLVSVPTSQIKPLVHFLRSLRLTAPDLRRLFTMCPQILTQKLPDLIHVVTFLLREVHVDFNNLRHVIHRRPRLLTCSVPTQLRPTLYFLQTTVGLTDVAKQTSLLSCSVEGKFIPRIDYFMKLGFSRREAVSMFRRFPSLFCYSIEENFEPKFDYFVVEMGRDVRELKDFPQYFSFSLENRIKPRHGKCVESGVCLTLPLMLKLSEGKFQERLEVCCDSSIPVRSSPLWCTNNTNCDIH